MGMTESTSTDIIQSTSTDITEKISTDKTDNITIKKSTYNNMIKVLVLAIGIATFMGGYSIGTMDSSDSLSTEEIKEIISEINKNAVPTPVQQLGAPIIPSTLDITFAGNPMMGDPDAPLTIIEFSDFQCPFCSRFHEQTLPAIMENYIDTGKVNFVYRDLPLSFHPNANPASIAAECANEQGKFWEYHDVLFDKQSQWQSLGTEDFTTNAKQFASDIGLESASFESCLSSSETASKVSKDSRDAASYGATGTPTFFIGNEKNGFVKIVGAQPFAAFEAEINSQLG